MQLSITLENFAYCRELQIVPGTVDQRVRLHLDDVKGRRLELHVRVSTGLANSLKVLA